MTASLPRRFAATRRGGVVAAALVTVAASRCASPRLDNPNDTGVVTQNDAASDSDGAVFDAADAASADSVSDVADDSGRGWRPVSEALGCPLFEANVDEIPFAPLTWTACGDGCRVSSGGLSKYPVHKGTSGGRTLSGDIHLLLDEPVDAGIRVRTVRLSDGKTLGAVELRTTTVQCLPLGADTNATYFGFAGPKGTNAFAAAHVTSAGLVWSKTFVGLPAIPMFAFEWNGGYGLSLGDGTIRTLLVPDDAALITVASDGVSFVGDGLNDLAVWSGAGWSGFDVLRGFHRKRGVTETYVAKTDASLVAPALSNEKLVAVAVSGPKMFEGTYASAWWAWTARPSQPADVTLVDGPAIPVDAGALRAVTGGDYAAMLGCHSGVTDNKVCTVHVVQMSTKKTWRIGPRPAEALVKVMAMTGGELVVGVVDYPFTAISRKEIHRFLRFDLTKLDALAAAWL